MLMSTRVTGIACEALNCVAHDFIILHIAVLSFSDSRVSTRGINCGAVNCHCPRAMHMARTMALQRWVESRNYLKDKFISYTSWFNIFVYFPLHFRTPVFQHGASLVLSSFPLFLSLDSPPLYMLPHRGGLVLFPQIWLLHRLWHPHVVVILYSYTPHSTKLGILISPCLSVSPSVCGQNRVHSVSPIILAGSISYLHILSSNFRRCVAYKGFWKKFEVLAKSLNL